MLPRFTRTSAGQCIFLPKVLSNTASLIELLGLSELSHSLQGRILLKVLVNKFVVCVKKKKKVSLACFFFMEKCSIVCYSESILPKLKIRIQIGFSESLCKVSGHDFSFLRENVCTFQDKFEATNRRESVRMSMNMKCQTILYTLKHFYITRRSQPN